MRTWRSTIWSLAMSTIVPLGAIRTVADEATVDVDLKLILAVDVSDSMSGVATNSQGLEIKRFTVKTLSRETLHASVVAALTPDNWLRKSERENEIRYDLVWERGRWAIDDIHSVIEPNAWSLRAVLKQYLVR
jgi:hypothetical protein